MIVHDCIQGSDEWFAVRRGVITGSRFKDARDYKAPTAAQKKEGVTRGDPSAKLLAYARDVARERCGGAAAAKFQSAAMRTGVEEEPVARMEYEVRTGNLVEPVGFITSDCGSFGLSPVSLVGDDGVLEIKTLVSSDTLFTALADRDLTEYMDQCLGYLWLLGRQWVDLALWVPDLNHLAVRRITRDEGAIRALESDLMAFARLVAECEAALKLALVA